MNRYLLVLLFLIVGSSAWGQWESDPTLSDTTARFILQIWDGPLPDKYNSSEFIRTEPFIYEGRRYCGYYKMRRSDILIQKDIQKKMAPQTMEEPAVFLKYTKYLPDTLRDYYFNPREWDTVQVFASREFGSLADQPVPFNIINIVSPDREDMLGLYKPGSELLKKSKETITLAELQEKLVPETRDRPCIFQFGEFFIGDDFDKYRVPKAQAVSIRAVPSEYFRELKGTGDEFYILYVYPFELWHK